MGSGKKAINDFVRKNVPEVKNLKLTTFIQYYTPKDLIVLKYVSTTKNGPSYDI